MRPSFSCSRALQALVIERAAAMRSALTPSERALWVLLRDKQLGVWFRRQVPMGRYIADFAAVGVRLVVEVDGGYHAHRRAADARRDRALARLGYRVLRVEARACGQRWRDAMGTPPRSLVLWFPVDGKEQLSVPVQRERDCWGPAEANWIWSMRPVESDDGN